MTVLSTPTVNVRVLEIVYVFCKPLAKDRWVQAGTYTREVGTMEPYYYGEVGINPFTVEYFRPPAEKMVRLEKPIPCDPDKCLWVSGNGSIYHASRQGGHRDRNAELVLRSPPEFQQWVDELQ